MEKIMFIVGVMLGLAIGLAFWGESYNRVTNSPELRQCLSQSGTTWKGGECIIIINK